MRRPTRGWDWVWRLSTESYNSTGDRCKSIAERSAGAWSKPDGQTHSSNPTSSTSVDRYQTRTCKTPVFCRPSATRKTTRFGQRDAKCNAAGAMHRVAWALQTAKATGQKCEKPWVNQGFTAERTGRELSQNTIGIRRYCRSAVQIPVQLS